LFEQEAVHAHRAVQQQPHEPHEAWRRVKSPDHVASHHNMDTTNSPNCMPPVL
jgi:hypothetical protein